MFLCIHMCKKVHMHTYEHTQSNLKNGNIQSKEKRIKKRHKNRNIKININNIYNFTLKNMQKYSKIIYIITKTV